MKTRNRQLRTIWLDEDNDEDEGDLGVTLDSSWVVSILNGESLKGHPSPASCRRIHELLDDLLQLVALRKTLKPLVPQLALSRFLSRPNFSVLELAQRCDGLLDSINEKLKRYRSSPRIYAHGLDGPIEQTTNVQEEGDFEKIAVWMLVRNLSNGTIDRYRQCSHCGRWLYAITGHQKYCSGSCRTREHSQGAEFREKRARYMRDTYRPAQKERDEQAKRQVSARKKGRKH